MINKQKQGRTNKARGQRFELFVRKDLEKKGWVVLKNPNNLIDNKFTQGKSKYNPFTKRLMMNSGGYPDFIIYKQVQLKKNESHWTTGEFSGHCNLYEINFCEVKSNGYLDKIEKEKADWYLKNKMCSKFLVAKKIKVGRKVEVEYKEFKNE